MADIDLVSEMSYCFRIVWDGPSIETRQTPEQDDDLEFYLVSHRHLEDADNKLSERRKSSEKYDSIAQDRNLN
jgi:hypothetical protein